MENKIDTSKINNIIQKNNQKTRSSNVVVDSFTNVLNAAILAADMSDSLEHVSIGTPMQNALTLRCLLGSVNLPKAEAYGSNDYTQFLPSYGTGEYTASTAQEISRNISRMYEGGEVAGNFDGQGISIGYLQWNLGSGTLQPLLKEISSHADFNKIFSGTVTVKDSKGNLQSVSMADEIRSMLGKSRTEQLQWAKSINNSNNKLKEPWNGAFNKLVKNENFMKIQDKYAKPYFNKADRIVNDSDIGVGTVRGYALAFDIAVQNGSVKQTAKNLIVEALAGKNNKLTNPKNPTLTKNQRDVVIDLHKKLEGVTDEDTRKLYYTAAAVAISSRNQYAKDVWSRKSTIVSGSGVVHGKSYALHSMGLSDNALT
ncbi:hypothetical protein GC105_14750 [Alkalibaculum sp. M08DMB]|uniref:Uncharacterized protein n=1 Tax=Alkalibaculum sporogenes TaxID=2655001 RepID=A0A6A7KCK8_9FIRM|nr:hypothetical protein [Alkalibaculum sporogenes]MPW27041.1 hypothetical protein [Alkalibaculum sporogenes]